MKKTIALILTAILLIALIPAAQASESDYTVEILGGETSAYMTEVNGESALQVDVYLQGVTDDRLLTALSFDLGFEETKLDYLTDSQSLGVSTIYAVDASGTNVGERSLLVNEYNAAAGSLRFVLASDYGCRIETDQPLISLYFCPLAGQEAGTTFSFTLGGDTEAESVSMEEQGSGAIYVQRSVGSDLTPFTLSETIEGAPISAEIQIDPDDVSYNGSTPYVVRNGNPQTPRAAVVDLTTGQAVDPYYYRLTYRNNVEAGTAYIVATFRNGYAGQATGTFKIYLPGSQATTVENVENGIKVTWKAVPGAKGYVIYRRAWNLISSGWTEFKRWNNTTRTSWVDTTVYAGTRYQYGVKAYPKDPMNNYDLGVVGPLKTTVRITTRTLNSVTPGKGRIKIKWSGSKNFTGYQVQIATNVNFSENAKTIQIAKPTTYGISVSGLRSRKVYYVRVRSYHVFEGVKYFGQWSNMLFCKTT